MNKFFNKLPETFIIFDTEFTSWEGSQERNWKGENEYRELIQISALKIKKKENTIYISKKLNIYVLPRINKKLSNYFIKLTGITQNTIDKQGIPFKKAIDMFYKFCKGKKEEKYKLFSMGNDYTVIKENLKLNSINKRSRFYKWKKQFHDIKPLFSELVDINNYTSGTLYKAFEIKPHNKALVHNASWDCLSLFLSLKKAIHYYEIIFLIEQYF